jgi:TatD DNase family protein
MKLDCYFAFGGTLTYKNNVHGIEALKIIPRDRIVLETDCPYLTPEPHRGKINEPKYVALAADKAADILGLTRDGIADLTTANALRLFPKIDLSQK